MNKRRRKKMKPGPTPAQPHLSPLFPLSSRVGRPGRFDRSSFQKTCFEKPILNQTRLQIRICLFWLDPYSNYYLCTDLHAYINPNPGLQLEPKVETSILDLVFIFHLSRLELCSYSISPCARVVDLVEIFPSRQTSPHFIHRSWRIPHRKFSDLIK